MSSDEHGGHIPEPVHACERQPALPVFTAQLAVLVRPAARYSAVLVKHAEVLLPERDRRRPTQAGDPSRHRSEMLAPTRDLAVVEKRAGVVGAPDQLDHARVADAARRHHRLAGSLLALALSHRLDALDAAADRHQDQHAREGGRHRDQVIPELRQSQGMEPLAACPLLPVRTTAAIAVRLAARAS